MSGRITTPVQRTLTTTVNDAIEHINGEFPMPASASSRSSSSPLSTPAPPMRGHRDLADADQAVAAWRQPPLILNYSASTVPIINVAPAHGDGTLRNRTSPISASISSHTVGHRARCGDPLSVWRQAAPIQIELIPARCRRVVCRGSTALMLGGAEPDHTGRHAEDRRVRIHDQPQQFLSSESREELGHC